MSAVSRVKSFFFPFDFGMKEIREHLQQQKEIACKNNEKVNQMIATLNGEDDWFLKVIRPGKEERNV